MSKRYNIREGDEYEVVGKSNSGRQGKWTEEEDELLRDGVHELGKEWNEIARRVNGRTSKDCMMRWEYHIRPDLIKGPWSAEVS